MARSGTKTEVVLRLVDGSSERQELVLGSGHSHPPFAIGSRGEWRVQAGEPAAHLFVAFNGDQVYVCAIGCSEATINAQPLGSRWVVATLPCRITFGSAQLMVSERPASEPELAPPSEGDTSVRSPLARSTRAPVSEEVTSDDDVRLQAALKLSMAKADELAHAPTGKQLAVPTRPVLAPPAPPFRRPTIRPLRSLVPGST